MTKRALLIPLLALAAAPAAAQPSTRVPPPPALVRQLWADLEPDHLLRREGFGQLQAAITVERRDLNGDGRPEWFVEGTRACGAANCPRWIYRAMPDGRFQQVYDGAGSRIDVLPRRLEGWPALVSLGHMSCCETVFRRSEWNGSRYAWRDTEYRAEPRGRNARTVYHVSISNADARGRRRLVMDPMDAGGGLWISARHDVCARGREGECGAPTLVLQSAQLPAGRVCAAFRSEEGEGPPYASGRGGGWCGVTTPTALPGGGRGRALAVRPTRRDWAQMGAAYDAIFTGPGLPGKIGIDGVGALMSFALTLNDFYPLPCVPGTTCRSARR